MFNFLRTNSCIRSALFEFLKGLSRKQYFQVSNEGRKWLFTDVVEDMLIKVTVNIKASVFEAELYQLLSNRFN